MAVGFRHRGIGYVVLLTLVVTVVGAAGMYRFELDAPGGPGFADYSGWDAADPEKERDYCVQYRETDLAFVTRLMIEEGRGWYIQHEEDEIFRTGRPIIQLANQL